MVVLGSSDLLFSSASSSVCSCQLFLQYELSALESFLIDGYVGNLVLLFYLLFSCLLSGALLIVSLGRVGGVKGMVAFGDSWIQEYNEAGKLADDIIYMISERNLLPATGPEAQRHSSLIRRKITILGFRLDILQSIDSKLPGKQHLTEKEMNRRKDMLANLKSKAAEMASTLNMSNFANRDSLLGPETKAADATSRTTGLDNYGVVEQDEGLEKLEESMMSFKHIALAVNEELDLQTRLIATLDEHVDVTDSRLQVTILLLLQQLMQS
uniref:Syntaxin-52 n=1 Tax=Solanum tuberosum TaxID=4113 RepID=M1AZ73_SOLTU